MKYKPQVTIVILSWNTLEETKECISSLATLDYPDYEIVVVDNGSTDGSKEYLESIKNKITYVSLAENTGFTGGQIEALKHAKGKYLALINSDAVVAKDWLSVLVADMEKDKSVAAVGGRSFKYTDKQPKFDTDNEFYTYQVVDPRRGYPETLMTGPREAFVNSISGAGVLIRRKAVDECGYFDKRFFAYYEETDLFARFKRAGYKIKYNPNAHIWHKIAASTKGKPYFYLKQMERNRYQFVLKNFPLSRLPYFFYDYWGKFIKAVYKQARGKGDIEQKARVDAGLWNIKEIFRSIWYRLKIRSLDLSYLELIKKDANDKVTVVIPCYNYENYISEAIESALNQTVKPARVIVINDGSKDNSLKVISRYKDKIEIIDQKNMGIIKTKNKGLSLVDTEWVIFLDADDIMPPEYIEEILWASRNKEADVFYTDMQYFGARDDLLKFGRFSGYRIREGNFIHNSALIRTEKIKSVGGYKLAMQGGYEDWELYITMYEADSKFVHVSETTFLYRQHNASESRNQEALQKAESLVKQVKDLHPELFGPDTFAYVKSRGLARYVFGALKSFAKNPIRTTVHFIRIAPLHPRHLRYRWGIYRYKLRAFMDDQVYGRSLLLSRTRGLFRKLKSGDFGAIIEKFKKILLAKK